MKSGTPDEQLLIRYLLGELREEECLKVEQLSLKNDHFFEELEAVEAELTDDYVRGVLVGHRRKEFERRLLNTPRRAEEIEFAKLVARGVNPRQTLFDGFRAWIGGSILHNRFPQASAILATLALIVVTGLFSIRHWIPEPETPQISHAPSPAAPVGASHEAPTPTPTPAQPPYRKPLTFQHLDEPKVSGVVTLSAGATRGEGESNEIKIPPKATLMVFRIELASNDYKTYSASLSRVEGERLFVRNNLKASKSGKTVAIEVPVPPKHLPAGTSVLTLTGIGANGSAEEVGKYVVRVRAH